MPKRKGALLIGVCSYLVFMWTATVHAQSLQLTNPSGLNPGDAALSFPGVENTKFSGSYVMSGGGNTVTVTESGATFVRRDQGSGWIGNFAAGTHLLYSDGFDYASGTGPLIIRFDKPVSEVGLTAQADHFGSQRFDFTAFHDSTSLGSYFVAGIGTPNGDDSASFLGVVATGGNFITSIEITAHDRFGETHDYALGAFTFRTVPEPGTWALLGSLGTAGVGFLLRRRLRK